ncbi:MAG: lysozyme [Psychromonas sp.]
MKKTITSIVCAVGVILGIVAGTNHTLQTSSQGLAHIANLEGCRNNAYQCSAATWTNGIGHTTDVAKNSVITNEQIAQNYIYDVAHAERVVNKYLQVKITQAQFDILVSFVFNLGEGNFKRSTLLKKMNKKQFISACKELYRWVYVNGKSCQNRVNNCYGLVTRRAIETNACLNGW